LPLSMTPGKPFFMPGENDCSSAPLTAIWSAKNAVNTQNNTRTSPVMPIGEP